MKAIDFNETVILQLADREFAIAYLQDALEESDEEFVLALHKYVTANGGIAECAQKAGLPLDDLRHMLSDNGNPELRSIRAVLGAFGMELGLRPSAHSSAA